MTDLCVRTIAELKGLLKGRNQLDCFVWLNLGRSSKTLIPHEDGSVSVVSEIDGSVRTIQSVENLMTSRKTLTIADAIEHGCFYVYGYEVKRGRTRTYRVDLNGSDVRRESGVPDCWKVIAHNRNAARTIMKEIVLSKWPGARIRVARVLREKDGWMYQAKTKNEGCDYDE